LVDATLVFPFPKTLEQSAAQVGAPSMSFATWPLAQEVHDLAAMLATALGPHAWHLLFAEYSFGPQGTQNGTFVSVIDPIAPGVKGPLDPSGDPDGFATSSVGPPDDGGTFAWFGIAVTFVEPPLGIFTACWNGPMPADAGGFGST
jgi:hypothetical protein